MKLSDFNNPNSIEVTETYPFYHGNVLSEMESISIKRESGQTVNAHIDLELTTREKVGVVFTSNVKSYMTDWRMHENYESFATIGNIACGYAKKISEQMFKPNMFTGETWGIVYNKGKHTKRHSHFPYTYAFGYYLTDTKNSAPLIFPTANKTIYPKKGDLIIFPGHVQHEVPTIESDEERLMVAGNLYHSWTESKEKKINDYFAKGHVR